MQVPVAADPSDESPPRGRRVWFVLVLLSAIPVAASAADPVDRLAAVLHTATDFKQRLAAVIGLARQGTAKSVPALIAALQDAHGAVRGAAASALGKLGDARGKPALEALLQHEKDSFVVGQAQSALAALLRGSKPAATRPASELQVDGTLGSLDEQVAQDGVNGRLAQAMSCFKRELQNAPYLGGQVEFKFRVAADGKVKWVYLRRSDLGSLSAEQCILEEMRQATFGAPEGGEAEFTIPLKLDGRNGAASPDAGAPPLPGRLEQSCPKLMRPDPSGRPLSLPSGLRLTLYVDGEGAVLSAGLAAEAEIPVPSARELVARLKAINLGSHPAGGTTKITAPFPCSSR